MSNHTHIKWEGRYRGKRKWDNQQPWQMDHRAIRTVYDRSDRNYKPRDQRDRQEYDRRRVTDKRIPHKEGLFRNAKESNLIINDLPPTIRRNIQNEVAGIVAPNDSVEFLRPSLDEVWKHANGHRNYNQDRPNYNQDHRERYERNEINMRNDFPDSRYRHSRGDYSKDRNREYNDRCPPRDRQEEFRQPYNNYRNLRERHGNWREHSVDRQRRQPYRDLDDDRQQNRDNYGRRAQSMHHYDIHENRRSRRDDYDRRNDRYHRSPDDFPPHKYQRRSTAPSPQLPSMFESGYRPQISRRILLQSPISVQRYNSMERCRRYADQKEKTKSPQPSPTTGEYPPSPAPEENSDIAYPSHRVAERILAAVPKLPLKDDSRDRYGATARGLLKTSLRALRRHSQPPMQDFLNRTTRLSYNTFTQDERFGDVASENLFQPDQPPCIQEIYNLSPPPTPEREKQFNKTLIEELHLGGDDLDLIQNPFVNTNQDIIASLEGDGNIWSDNNNWLGNAVSSPGDQTFLENLARLSEPIQTQDFNFDPSDLF